MAGLFQSPTGRQIYLGYQTSDTIQCQCKIRANFLVNASDSLRIYFLITDDAK